jgi:hypothetical protein
VADGGKCAPADEAAGRDVYRRQRKADFWYMVEGEMLGFYGVLFQAA